LFLTSVDNMKCYYNNYSSIADCRLENYWMEMSYNQTDELQPNRNKFYATTSRAETSRAIPTIF